ncbi:Putative chloramphenicol acetyltransferase-like domain superfamily [Colletotrichum destructivum]|uniref:Chloramphenicol acetyltransferase-like domain superfamily n=1 Tax=Colletotrichum destructivum TaxID=34406 RepID=A0AAX4IBT4_9PEZI|nr:Putative chloramphenicol acetyltransferase-like domain superfamily [Colletotrichum destructivum]
MDCLTALIWAYATMARMRTKSPDEISLDWEARLLTPVNWRGRAFHHETVNFFGNTTAYLVTRVPLKEVMDAAENIDLLAHLASSINAMVEAVDEDFVATQTALMCACPDLRYLCTNICLEHPTGFSVDSWRTIGVDLTWDIPGVPTTMADVVRPVNATTREGTALILPNNDLGSNYQVSVSLQPQAMDILCNDKRWMQWFYGVVR